MGTQTSARWVIAGLLLLALAGGTATAIIRPTMATGDLAATPLAVADAPTDATAAQDPTSIPPIESSTETEATMPSSDLATARTSTESDTTALAEPAGDGGTMRAEESSCLTTAEHAPTGDLVVVPGTSEPSGGGTLTTYLVEVEAGLGVDAECFAAEVDRVLADDRSWGGDGRMSMQRVESGPVAFRVTLASPATTDQHCRPLDTNGIYSCWTGDGRAMINVWRWEHGTDEYSDDLDTYREYVINHEVGHGFGHGHVDCTDTGELAPVMMQQTKALDGCSRNGWPLAWER